ncbi:MAG TPA: glycosyltransferase [Polyangiaceae bacterium]|nr:glycosyltransferase [Polyangiaceae bacterium]
MKISVFTPTHRPDYLGEVHRSLVRQTVKDFEWVVVPNGPPAPLPEEIVRDPRVKIAPAPPDMVGKIGALKRFACDACSGDVFVELDHDDLLTERALERIQKAVLDGAGFVYSDFVNFLPDGSSQTYDARFGWTAREETIDGHAYRVSEAFDCDARSLYEIFFAPNHVRAWARDTYYSAGGHDPSLEVCDDHDLVCRTYLTGDRMVRVPECLYLYRLQEGDRNSYLEQNAQIQKLQLAVGNKYFYRLVEEWCRREGLPRWDLGGRVGCPEGYRSIDLADADLVHDVTTGLPFADSSVGILRAYDFLEHVPAASVVPVMNEIHRVLVPGGWLLSRTPSTDGRGAFQDPTHVSFWNENSFWYYTKKDFSRFVRGIACRFQGTRVWTEFPTEWHRHNQIPYVYADLCALKGQRVPGVQEI